MWPARVAMHRGETEERPQVGSARVPEGPRLNFARTERKRRLARKHPPVQGAFRGSSPYSQIDICQLTRIDFQCQAIRPCGADETPVRSLCSRMFCTRRGMIGADVRPDWGPHVNKRMFKPHRTKV